MQKGRKVDAKRMQAGRTCGRPQTQNGRGSDVVFDRLFLGSTVIALSAPYYYYHSFIKMS